MKKNKILSEKEISQQKIAKHYEECLRPLNVDKRFIKTTHYMLNHKIYISLSFSSKEALRYMQDWATGSLSFWNNGKFEFSASLLSNKGVMSSMQATRCFKELREKGFINAEYKNGAGAINRWSFSDRWYTGEKEPMPEIDNYRSVKNQKQ